MGADPEPENPITGLDAQGSVGTSDANGKETAYLLEME